MDKIQQRQIDSPTKALNVKIPLKLWNKIDRLAKEQSKSKAMVTEEIIRYFFEKKSKNTEKS